MILGFQLFSSSNTFTSTGRKWAREEIRGTGGKVHNDFEWTTSLLIGEPRLVENEIKNESFY